MGTSVTIKKLREVYHIFPELAPGLWSNANDIGKFIVAIQKSLNGTTFISNKNLLQRCLAALYLIRNMHWFFQ